MKPQIHVFTNGYEGTWPSIEYAAGIAQVMGTPLTLIGALEGVEDDGVEEIFSRAIDIFREKGIEYRLELRNAQVEAVIQALAEQDTANLLIFGPFGRSQIRRMLVGRSFRHILAHVSAPVIYVPKSRWPVKNVLICLGGLSYGSTMENIGIKVAEMTRARLTFLTVVPPMDMDYPEARKMHDNWQNLAETDTITGRTLRKAMDLARAAGLDARVKTRNGSAVEEILAEIGENDYDLVCMGSPYSSKSLRHLYTPNVTADVAESADIPILTARFIEK